MKRFAVPFALLLAMGCGGKTPTAPTPVATPAVPACQTNRTATVTFRNAGGRTVDISWNNAIVATLSPGQTSAEKTVTAGGAQYVMDTIITNTNIHPCQVLVATPIQCQNNSYATCSGF